MIEQNAQKQDPYKITLPKFDPAVVFRSQKIGSEPKKILENIGIVPGSKIADFGCGVGYFVIDAAKMTGSDGKVFAIDIDRKILDVVKTKAIESGLRNIYGIKADLEKPMSTGLEDESIDLALMINILYMIDKKEEVLKEAYRVLKSGGKLAIMEWSEKGEASLLERSEAVSTREINEFARKLGFKKLKSFEASVSHEVVVFLK